MTFDEALEKHFGDKLKKSISDIKEGDYIRELENTPPHDSSSVLILRCGEEEVEKVLFYVNNFGHDNRLEKVWYCKSITPAKYLP